MSENQNRPRGRKRNITGQADEIKKQEQNLGTGSVGNAGQYQDRQSFQASRPAQRPASADPFRAPSSSRAGQSARRPVIHQGSQSSSSGNRAGGAMPGMSGKSKGGCLPLIILAVVVLLGGGGWLTGLFGGGDSSPSPNQTAVYSQPVSGGSQSSSYGGSSGSSGSQSSSGSLVSELLGGGSSGGSSLVQSLMGSGSWYSLLSGADGSVPSTGIRTDGSSLNTRVAEGSREKFTVLKGNGKDQVTLLIYMCGSDLETRNGMATRDIQEMLSASFGSRVNLLLYTGGSSRWRNSSVSSRSQQIWQIKNKKLVCLEEDMGSTAMTNPNTLLRFVQYGAKNYPADRYQLILWDHGSGSVGGYGYDEQNKSAGSMSLAGIDTALKGSGLRFDFIGFDTCLLGTVENALMLSDYADYMIASEESEPGIGWYYTNWLTQLGKNTSISTLALGKIICDDFTSACQKSCPGQTTTLSVVDLAELAHTVPKHLAAFSASLTGLIEGSDYQTVSDARNGCREFASSSRTDMVDLTDLATKVGNSEGAALAASLKEAIKYNRASVTNAYGLSIFFPYKKVSNVSKAISTYEAIGMDSNYSEAIRAFASMESAGQAVSSQHTWQVPSILNSGSSSSLSSGAYGNSDLISSLLSGFLNGSGSGLFSGRQADSRGMTSYFSTHLFNPANLVFDRGVLRLPAEQWQLVHSVDLNIFYDDGSGYIDLGLDAICNWDENGNLLADTSGAWLALNGQIAPYYRMDTSDDGENWSMTGYIPVLLNGSQAQLLVTFDDAHEGGYIAGARFVYAEEETDTVAKALTDLEADDQIQLICDYYDYNGRYTSSHALGKPITVGDGLKLTDLLLPDASKAVITYRLTDIYNQAYWTAPLTAGT